MTLLNSVGRYVLFSIGLFTEGVQIFLEDPNNAGVEAAKGFLMEGRQGDTFCCLLESLIVTLVALLFDFFKFEVKSSAVVEMLLVISEICLLYELTLSEDTT